MAEENTDKEQLLYSIVVRLGDMEKQLKKASGAAQGTYRLMQDASKSGTENMAKDAERATTRINRALASTSSKIGLLSKSYANAGQTFAQSFKGLFIGLAGAFTIRNATQLADQYTSIQNALNSTGLTGKDLTEVFDGLYSAAQRNSTPIASLVQLYSRLAVNQKELGTTSQGIVHFSDTIAQLLRAGGTSAQEASGALLQLSQALGSSRIQAEEFNSIIDGAPTILRAAANGIKEAGGSVSKLRQLVLDGKLSNQAFFRGIEVGAGQVTQNLEGTSKTVSQAMTNLYNSMVKAAGRFDTAAGATNSFGQALQELATTVDNVDMGNLVTNIDSVIGALKSGVEWFLKYSGAADNWAREQGKKIGTDKVGNWLGQAGFFNIPATFESNEQREARLKPILGEGQEGKTEWRRQGEESGKAFTEGAEDAIQQWYKNKYPNGVKDALREEGTTVLSSRGQGKPSATKQDPVSVNDYPVVGGKTGAGSKEKLNDYQRQLRIIKEQTEAINAEREALSQLNPAINDHGYAVEKAQAKQTLMNAAKREHLQLTPELIAEIERESDTLARATAARGELLEAQEKLKQKLEESKDIAKDFTRTFTDGLINGKNGVEALGDSLMRLGQRFIDSGINMLFDNLFKVGGGGGLGGIFGGIGSFFGFGKQDPWAGMRGYASGTSNTGGARGQPMGIVHGQEAVIPLPNGGRVPVQVFGGQAQSQAPSKVSPTKISLQVETNKYFDARVKEISMDVAGDTVLQGIKEYDGNLPNTIGQKIAIAQRKNRM